VYKAIGTTRNWVLACINCIDHRCPLKEVHCPKHRHKVLNLSKLVEVKALHPPKSTSLTEPY